ncbi:MAG: SPOR domain-containing protein [Pseudomonadota bacterium]
MRTLWSEDDATGGRHAAGGRYFGGHGLRIRIVLGAILLLAVVGAILYRPAGPVSLSDERHPTATVQTDSLEQKVLALQDSVQQLQQIVAGLSENMQTTALLLAEVAPPAAGVPDSLAEPMQAAGEISAAASDRELPVIASTGNDKLPAAVRSTASDGQRDGPWHINLMSASRESMARQFSEQAASLGIRTRQRAVEVNGTPYWRVQVEGFPTRESAEQFAREVKATLGLQETWIFREERGLENSV